MQKCKRKITYQVANVGSRSAITRNMYRKQVNSLKNKFAIRIRRPEIKIKDKINYRQSR